MSTKNRVIWREGMFIKPQHLQQQQRHLDFILHSRFTTLLGYGYGFHTVELDYELLKLGRVGLSFASGIFPDGTIFDLPYQDYLPAPIEIEQADQTIYLALPIVNDTLIELEDEVTEHRYHTRYKAHNSDVRDVHTIEGNISKIAVAQLQTQLLKSSKNIDAYTVLPLCRIKKKSSDGVLQLDSDFIPTCSRIQASTVLARYSQEIADIIAERSKQIADRIGLPGQQGIADVAEFMMLQLLNRAKPLFEHFAAKPTLHPESFYCELVQLCGELMTFTETSRMVDVFPIYYHDHLTETFQPIIYQLRKALNTVLTPRAVAIELQKQAHGILSATVVNIELLQHADFVMAIKAQLPQEQLRQQVVQQIKVASMTRIRDFVSLQIPGVPLVALSTVPRQLPYHAGFTYFMFDTHSTAWQDIIKDRSIALHLSGEFPELNIQLWAIRSE